MGSHAQRWQFYCIGKKPRQVADYPGAVKCHWFVRQPRAPTLWELAMTLDTCV